MKGDNESLGVGHTGTRTRTRELVFLGEDEPWLVGLRSRVCMRMAYSPKNRGRSWGGNSSMGVESKQ